MWKQDGRSPTCSLTAVGRAIAVGGGNANHAEAIVVAFERGRRPTHQEESEAVENAEDLFLC